MPTDDMIDYETYREIMGELLQPIDGEGLDTDTLKRLYESKMVYLENLRVRCFIEMNQPSSGFFTQEDYQLILTATQRTSSHLRELVLCAMTSGLARRKVS
jgi:lipase chaperone LimK